MRFVNSMLLASVIAISWQYAHAVDVHRLSMLPRYSAEEIINRINLLSQYLTDVLGTSVEPVVAVNFTRYEERLKNGDILIGYENPYVYAKVTPEHEALAMALKGKDRDKFRGIIITRADSNIVSVEELAGKIVYIVARTSAGGFLSQKLTLLERGLDVDKDMRIVEAAGNKQETVILSVYHGDADAGFIRESALHIADKYVPPSQIKVIKRTAWLPNWALSVRKSLPQEVKHDIRKAVLDLKSDHKVLKALKIDGFRHASDQDYDPVRQAAGMPIPR